MIPHPLTMDVMHSDRQRDLRAAIACKQLVEGDTGSSTADFPPRRGFLTRLHALMENLVSWRCGEATDSRVWRPRRLKTEATRAR